MIWPLQAASTCRITFGPHAGQRVLAVQGAMTRQMDWKQAAPTSTVSA